jgi:hypothetical protein
MKLTSTGAVSGSTATSFVFSARPCRFRTGYADLDALQQAPSQRARGTPWARRLRPRPTRPLRPRMTAGNLGALVPVTTCGAVGARGKACPLSPRTRLMPNRRSYTPATTAPRPATTPIGTPTWARIRHHRRCRVNSDRLRTCRKITRRVLQAEGAHHRPLPSRLRLSWDATPLIAGFLTRDVVILSRSRPKRGRQAINGVNFRHVRRARP